LQHGYYYPWRSTVAPFNGEDTYLDLGRICKVLVD
jgi:hypothetical protein